MDPTELLIGGEAQYFFDDAVIETLVNLKRTIHRPERHPGNPIIQSDRPWEQITYASCNGAQFWLAGRGHRSLSLSVHQLQVRPRSLCAAGRQYSQS